MAKRKKTKPEIDQYEEVVALYKSTGPKLVFITTERDTLALCPEIAYDKRVAWHNPSDMTVKERHESVKYLFQQYIEDARRCIK